jgi:hypothetical protein
MWSIIATRLSNVQSPGSATEPVKLGPTTAQDLMAHSSRNDQNSLHITITPSDVRPANRRSLESTVLDRISVQRQDDSPTPPLGDLLVDGKMVESLNGDHL